MPSVDNKPRFGWIFPKSIEKLIDNDYITVADSQTIDSKTENKTDSGVESTYNNKYKNKRKSQVDSLLIKQADEFDEDEDEGWDDLRCKLRTILLSKLHDFTTNKNLNQLVEYSIIDESESLSDSLVDQDIDSLLPNPLDSSLSNTVDADNKSTSGVIGSKPDNQIVLKSDKLNDSDVSSTLDIRRASKRDAPASQIWWWPGGRMFRGETFYDTAIRKIKDETGNSNAVVSPVGIVSVWNTFFPDSNWDKERQEGREGTQTVNTTVVCRLQGDGKIEYNKSAGEAWAVEAHKWISIEEALNPGDYDKYVRLNVEKAIKLNLL
eukprot:gene17642-23220_t